MSFREDTEADLLGYMAMATSDLEAARRAGSEFWRRHGTYMYRAIARTSAVRALACGAVDDVLQEVFLRAFERADSYRAPPGLSPDDDRRAVRAWLGGIATNVTFDLLSDAKAERNALSVLRDWQAVEEEAEKGNGPPPALVAEVRAELDELSDRERDVLFTTLQYDRPGEKNQRLPNDVSTELADRWSTTPENIRVIRKRTRDRLRVVLEAKRARLVDRSKP